ncbi:MAG: hypothetical protein ACI843_000437, partial [Psychrobacter glaciei]
EFNLTINKCAKAEQASIATFLNKVKSLALNT